MARANSLFGGPFFRVARPDGCVVLCRNGLLCDAYEFDIFEKYVIFINFNQLSKALAR